MENNHQNQENRDPIYEKLDHFVNSYLRGVLLIGGIIMLGLGNMFFGDKLIGVGIIVLLLGLFYNSFNGLICKTIHLALTAILLVGATAHLVISKLGGRVKDRLDDTRDRTKTVQIESVVNDVASDEKEQGEQVFHRVVLDGDVEDDVPGLEALDEEEKTAVAPAMKPKFKATPLAAAISEQHYIESFEEHEVYCYIPEEDEAPVQCYMETDIPDEVVINMNKSEASASPVTAKARRISTRRLSNGVRITARAVGSE